MSAENRIAQNHEYFLKPGYIYIPQAPTLISTVLGSCVAVCLWDRVREYGGMNHFIHPVTKNPKTATARYGNVATRALIRLFLEEGSRRDDLEAQIFGGACKPGWGAAEVDVSRRNVDVARRILLHNSISIVSEDVGGVKGRKLVFNSNTNEAVVIRVERLRNSDWYPYEGR